MIRLQSSSVSRRLLAWFVAATVLPIAGLAWLGWAIIQQDRNAEQTRVSERRDQVLGVATAALQRMLAEAEERLTNAASVAGNSLPDAGVSAKEGGAALVVLDRHGLVARSGAFLPYYPATATREVPAELFAKAGHEEFGRNDPAAAAATLQSLARAPDIAVRAEALLRLARNYRKAGDSGRALAAFDALEPLGETPAGGVAAGLAARQGRALLLQSAGRTDDGRHEGSAILSGLDAGRWPLTRTQYEFARTQALRWGATPTASADADTLALSETIEAAWRIWLATPPAEVVARQRQTFRTTHGPTLLFWRATRDRLVVLVTGTRFLQTTWLAELRAVNILDTDVALTDGEGHAVLGQPDVPVSQQTVRSASLTSLPWTVHAISPTSPGSGLSRSAQLVLAIVALGGLMLLASAYVIRRAIARELSVAALQSDFVAAVSHEFRSPLTTIRQLSEMLTRGRVSTADRRQQFYETLLRESDRLNRLVEELLDFGRMEARALEYRFGDVDPEPLLREVVSEFQEQIAAAGFVVDLQVSGPLPRIRADKGSLSRVFWNLLDNAVKYSPEHRSVRVEAEHTGGHVVVHVRDRGIGIPAPEQAGIFRKFVRGAAAKMASIRGTGLGLAMASQIVDAHGGRITVDSTEGVGSTFTVLLPVTESQ